MNQKFSLQRQDVCMHNGDCVVGTTNMYIIVQYPLRYYNVQDARAGENNLKCGTHNHTNGRRNNGEAVPSTPR